VAEALAELETTLGTSPSRKKWARDEDSAGQAAAKGVRADGKAAANW